MTLEPVEQTAASESSWVDAVGDDPSEIGRALLAQGERVLEEVRQSRSDADSRLDAVEKEVAEIRGRLGRPSLWVRFFEAVAAGLGKFLDNKPAVVVLLLILAGALGLTITTPLGNVGAQDELAQDDDDGGGDTGDGGTDGGEGEDDGMVIPL